MPATTPDDMPRAFESAFNTGDIDQVMQLYESECVLVPAPGQTVSGAAAIREALLGFLAVKGQIKLQFRRVLVSGDLALVNSHWDLNGTGADGAPVSLSGDTSEVIRRQSDGTWRYVIDDPFSVLAG
jgi:uncharacterized protein (TIGR02246 family)